MFEPKNVRGGALACCCRSPKTGYFRDGHCHTDETDFGAHVVCALMTEEFLAFTKARGNDLSAPSPASGFPGLKPGDRWCLCASRWREAMEAGAAPPVILAATHQRALEYVSLEELERHALDLYTD